MNRIIAILIITCLPVQSARAVFPSNARKAIQAQYEKLFACFGRKDANGMLSVYSPDYSTTNTKGRRQTLAEVSQQLPIVFGMAKSLHAVVVIRKLVVKGESAVATVKISARLTFVNPRTKTDTTNIQETTSEDQWIKGPKGWLMRSSRELSHGTPRKVNG